MKTNPSLSCVLLGFVAFAISAPATAATEVTGETLASITQQSTPETTGMMTSTGSATQNEGLFSRLFSKTDLIWTAQLNGPSLTRGFDTNYNAFQNNFAPLYIYHTLDTIFRFDSLNQVGMELSAKESFGHAVPGRDGFLVEPGLEINDPQFWYRHNALVNTSWLRIDGAFSVFPGVTSYSRNEDFMLLSTALDGTYHIKLPDYRWKLYFTSRIRPTMYKQDGPSYWKHEQLFLSTGYFVGYQLSESFELTHSTAFDCNYYKDGSGSFIRGDAYDDRAQLELNYRLRSGFARVGAYVQSLIADPALETSIVGLELSINFLSAK